MSNTDKLPSRQCHQLAGLSSPFLLRRAGTAVALFSAYLPEGSVESRNRVESLTSRLYLFLSSISCSTSSLSYVFWHCVEIFVCNSKIYSYAFARIPPLLYNIITRMSIGESHLSLLRMIVRAVRNDLGDFVDPCIDLVSSPPLYFVVLLPSCHILLNLTETVLTKEHTKDHSFLSKDDQVIHGTRTYARIYDIFAEETQIKDNLLETNADLK